MGMRRPAHEDDYDQDDDDEELAGNDA